MSDHIEAMARVLQASRYNAHTDWHEDAAEAWAAGIGALIAHQPCDGTGDKQTFTTTRPGIGQLPCLGPHTTIDRGDGTKLYADRTWTARLVDTDWWPSEWRVE